jgi:hypothetical protein
MEESKDRTHFRHYLLNSVEIQMIFQDREDAGAPTYLIVCEFIHHTVALKDTTPSNHPKLAAHIWNFVGAESGHLSSLEVKVQNEALPVSISSLVIFRPETDSS